MICKYCLGLVVWCGPFSALTHAKCTICGEINPELLEEEEEEEEGNDDE